MTVVSEALIGTVISEAFQVVKNVLKPSGAEITVSKQDLVQALHEHNITIENITKTISFKDLRGSKKLSDQYVQLDIELQPRRYKMREEKGVKSKIDDLIKKLIII